MTMHIVIAPSGFKESLGADEVADCIEQGVRRVLPDARIDKAPLVDGGEGFSAALVAATGGALHHLPVVGPVGEPVIAHYGILGGDGPRTAVLEMASAAGLRLVPSECRDPFVTTTYGVGQLIAAALEAGAERILVGCGDSGTNDGGMGMVQALGGRFLDGDGRDLAYGGGELARLARIDLSGLDPRLAAVEIDVACNPFNVLCGPQGVARVFGPQKGASPATVERLADALDRYAAVIERDCGLDLRTATGSGASGGLGSGLALIGATLHPRYEIVMRYIDLDGLLDQADLVITAEGGIDFQTPRGKVPAEVAARAKQRGLPVVALAGTVGQGAATTIDAGIDAFSSILQAPCSLLEAMEATPELLADCAEAIMRMMRVGARLAIAA
jgi:glycerate 2-kinase